MVALDLTDPSARGGLPAIAAERGLTVDVLVNNAGFSTTGPVYRSDRDREMAMIRTDVEAVVDLCSIFVPGMVQRHRGAVLNVASTAAFQPLPGQAGYGASQGVRAVLQPGVARRAARHGCHRHRRCARAR